MADFMDLISWIGGEPFAVGLHRKKILAGGFEKLPDIERQALQYEADWHRKYGLGGGTQYFMKFKNGGGVASLPESPDVLGMMEKAIQNQGFVPDFVKRALNPETPTIETDGQPSTVRLGSVTNDGIHYVYPTIFPLNTPAGPVLTQMEGQRAVDEAFKRGEYIKFNSGPEANFVAENFSNIIPER